MTTKNKENIKILINEKLAEISNLKTEYNQDSANRWKLDTLLILESAVGTKSVHYKRFNNISYKSNIITIGRPEENLLRDKSAYILGLEESQNILKSILFGIERDLI